ncbi:MAG: dephospho-CoA kinase [Granulosicoccus sp.]|nr:dephospho-CoA kinase [Granulosicoccus sp.]
MLLIGLTGGVASGKSYVSDCFSQLGVPIIDADLLAREVVATGSAGLQALIDHFGPGILTSDGTLDRTALRHIVFDNPAERQFINETLHPLIRELSNQRIDTLRQQGSCAYAIYAVPLLVETDQTERYDRIVVVDIPESVQLERLTARDGSTEDEARRIINAQATRKQRLAVADDIIDNSGSQSETKAQIEKLHVRYVELSEEVADQ